MVIARTPRVSVVMPVHNALPYLDAAVESILCQTLDDFEFVILDDATGRPNGCASGQLEMRASACWRKSKTWAPREAPNGSRAPRPQQSSRAWMRTTFPIRTVSPIS